MRRANRLAIQPRPNGRWMVLDGWVEYSPAGMRLVTQPIKSFPTREKAAAFIEHVRALEELQRLWQIVPRLLKD